MIGSASQPERTSDLDTVGRACRDRKHQVLEFLDVSRRVDHDSLQVAVEAGVGVGDYRVAMALAAASASEPAPPPPEPGAIRAALPPRLAVEFDREWEIVLDRVKRSMDLADLHDLLNKWRHTAYQEMREPGSYDRMLVKAERILATGHNPDAARWEEMLDLIRSRQG